MSLVSRRAIQIAGPDKHDEIIITFRKEQDKTYTKITRTLSRDWKTGGIKVMKRNKPIEEGPFELANSSDYDEKMAYEDIDGSAKYMYFKIIENTDIENID